MDENLDYTICFLSLPPLSQEQWNLIKEAQMSQKSALAAWQSSNGDAEGSKQDGHGTVRPVPAVTKGSEAQRKAYSAPASNPSQGGTTRAGKDSSNCDDALGHPGKHHGEHAQAIVVSGRGPAAAKEQMSTNRVKGINSDKSFERPSDQEDMKW